MEQKKLYLVIAEASLETVPRELWSHPAVYKTARRKRKTPGQILLDRALHHQAMRTLRDAHKRGRPDIVHISLLEALSSPLNREGRLITLVHTIGDYVLFIDPSTRLPRNYNLFIGLMEQLFDRGQVPPEASKPLIMLKPMRLRDLIERHCPRPVILLAEDGEKKRLRTIAEEVVRRDLKATVVIGGFPHGDFSREAYDVADRVYAIYGGKPLETWTVVSHLLALIADQAGIV